MAKKVLCEVCGSVIPEERLEFLPETTTCVRCAVTSPYTQDQILGVSLGSAAEIEGMDIAEYEGEDSEY